MSVSRYNEFFAPFAVGVTIGSLVGFVVGALLTFWLGAAVFQRLRLGWRKLVGGDEVSLHASLHAKV